MNAAKTCLAVLIALWSTAARADVMLDIGPADPGTAKAQYNPATGEFIVSVNEVISWVIISDGLMNGPDGPAPPLPLGEQTAVVDSPNSIGEGGFFIPMTYTDVNLGRVAVAIPEVTAENVYEYFRLESRRIWVEPLIEGQIGVVPEPSALVMLLAAGLLALAACAWVRVSHRVSP